LKICHLATLQNGGEECSTFGGLLVLINVMMTIFGDFRQYSAENCRFSQKQMFFLSFSA
jgi:hypothetical protein